MRSLIDSLANGLHSSNALTRERVRDLVIPSDEKPAEVPAALATAVELGLGRLIAWLRAGTAGPTSPLDRRA
jgi:hypothetical protein